MNILKSYRIVEKKRDIKLVAISSTFESSNSEGKHNFQHLFEF